MPVLRSVAAAVRRQGQAVAASATVFAQDVGHGFLEVSHNTLALVGLVGVGSLVFFATQADARHEFEARTFGWLQARHEAKLEPAVLMAQALSEPTAISRATAADVKDLTRAQANVALWISRRYRVAPEPISRLVKEAWAVGDKVGIDPTLILSIMAIESSFNPFAQSTVGAQGLMQVMTGIHAPKYQSYGGNHAAFDPVTNLRVGVLVLKECIARAGSLDGGLRYYVGAANLADDGGYATKVLAEQAHLKLVAQGKTVAINAPLPQANRTKPVSPEIDPGTEAPAPAAAADLPLDTPSSRVALR